MKTIEKHVRDTDVASKHKFAVNEVFYSCQGEGYWAGRAACFVRFAGCNLRCSMEPGPLSPGGWSCDSEFTSSVTMTQEEIVAEIYRISHPDAMVVFTGGEPLRQLTASLVYATGRYCAVETNASLPLPRELQRGEIWITSSPKVAEHAVRLTWADELKYVRGHGQGIPRPAIPAKHKFLSPAFDGNQVDREALQWCIKLVKENPEWRLSCQQHKWWNVR